MHLFKNLFFFMLFTLLLALPAYGAESTQNRMVTNLLALREEARQEFHKIRAECPAQFNARTYPDQYMAIIRYPMMNAGGAHKLVLKPGIIKQKLQQARQDYNTWFCFAIGYAILNGTPKQDALYSTFNNWAREHRTCSEFAQTPYTESAFCQATSIYLPTLFEAFLQVYKVGMYDFCNAADIRTQPHCRRFWAHRKTSFAAYRMLQDSLSADGLLKSLPPACRIYRHTDAGQLMRCVYEVIEQPHIRYDAQCDFAYTRPKHCTMDDFGPAGFRAAIISMYHVVIDAFGATNPQVTRLYGLVTLGYDAPKR